MSVDISKTEGLVHVYTDIQAKSTQLVMLIIYIYFLYDFRHFLLSVPNIVANLILLVYSIQGIKIVVGLFTFQSYLSALL